MGIEKVSSVEPESEGARCPACDTLLPASASICLMCGHALSPRPINTETVSGQAGTVEPDRDTDDAPLDVGDRRAESPVEVGPQQSPPEPDEIVVAAGPAGQIAIGMPISAAGVIESVLIDRQSAIVPWITAIMLFFTVIFGYVILQNAEPVTSLTLFPTLTPIPPTLTYTPAPTAIPSETPAPSQTPSPTQPPTPTETPRPARQHPITAGETLFGLSLFYDVSMESIAQQNGFTIDTPLQAGRVLQVPWPTATPPLTPIEYELNGEQVIADPTDCDRVEIQSGDSIAAIAARHNIDFNLLMRVNRLTEQSVLRPGDTMCIPQLVFGGVLPPTAGPSPTPQPTAFPPGPQVLYPPDGSIFSDPGETIVLQWLAVKDLAQDEWYMVELGNPNVIGSPVHNGFTRDNTFRVPESWRPTSEEEQQIEWRVSIVKVTGRRQDGGFIYTFGGYTSEGGRFVWMVSPTTPTPTLTPTPAATGEP